MSSINYQFETEFTDDVYNLIFHNKEMPKDAPSKIAVVARGISFEMYKNAEGKWFVVLDQNTMTLEDFRSEVDLAYVKTYYIEVPLILEVQEMLRHGNMFDPCTDMKMSVTAYELVNENNYVSLDLVWSTNNGIRDLEVIVKGRGHMWNDDRYEQFTQPVHMTLAAFCDRYNIWDVYSN